MTTWGGADVAAFAKGAGFKGDEIKRAQVISYAATLWNDHYCVSPTGVPSMAQMGLWAIPLTHVEDHKPGELYDPRINARVAHELWTQAGGDWSWHPVTQAFGGQLVAAAWQEIDRHNLWNVKAKSMTTPMPGLDSLRLKL